MDSDLMTLFIIVNGVFGYWLGYRDARRKFLKTNQSALGEGDDN